VRLGIVSSVCMGSYMPSMWQSLPLLKFEWVSIVRQNERSALVVSEDGASALANGS